MPTKQLPYPGYSWPFTQHAIAINPHTLYELLTCASLSEGQESPGREITDAMIQRNILTANVRDGHADAWRDYQQVLAELGLMYSTKIERSLRLTSAGKMYLAGEIGFSELMTAQALRYQYPNGYKYDLQSRLREQLGAGVTNLIDLQVEKGISVKPAVLIAHVLIALTERKDKASINTNECLAFLLPVKNNSEWNQVVDDIVSCRKGSSLVTVNEHASRNVQDWFKFLGKTDFFEVHHGEIRLSEYGNQAMQQLKRFCDTEVEPSAFWKPEDSSRESRLDWFDYFGEIPVDLEVANRPLDQVDFAYEKENYIAGRDQDVEDEHAQIGKPSFTLGEITRETPRMQKTTNSTKLDAALVFANLEKGIVRRHIKTQEHEEMVIDLTNHLKKQGARVFEDGNSFDVLAIWPNGQETLFEIKTITQKSTQQRMRIAVGQIEEYAYRITTNTGKVPDKVLVINVEFPTDSWYLDFLNRHMGISLVMKTKKGYGKHLSTNCTSSTFWGF